MDINAILMIANTVIGIYKRHQEANPGVPLSDEQVHLELLKEMAGGQEVIAAWFRSKGLPVPA